ncbi:hypothetical protein Trydic_g22095 [Trypoxylus dichotomus]
MLIATEFTVEGSNVNTVNIMYANKAYHGLPISIDVVMNTLLKYYAGDNYSIFTSNAPLGALTKREQLLPQSQFSNVLCWIILLPINYFPSNSHRLLLAMEEAKSSSGVIEVLKNIWFIGDPQVILCFYLAKFSIKMILNHNWEIMKIKLKFFLVPDSLECSERSTYFTCDFLWYAIGSFIFYILVLWLRDVSACIVTWFFNIRESKSKPAASLKNSQNNDDSNIILKAKEISKRYFNPHWFRLRFPSNAVENLSFELRKGTGVGLLGRNGAGKSTSFRILTKEVVPTTGQLDITVTSLGYCPQENALIDEFSGREMLMFYGQLRNQFELNNAVDYLLKKFGLDKIADRRCGTYSDGNRRKLSMCISIISFPSCILLDEPTRGVDPVSRKELWDLIKEIKGVGKTAILLITHNMDEYKALCDELCILKKGKVVKQASVESLKEKYCVGYIVNLRFKILTLPSSYTMEEDPKGDETDANYTNIREYLYNSFEERNVKMLGTHGGIMRIQIHNSDWSTIFKKIEALVADEKYNIQDYLVKEESLAEVLWLIAKEDNSSKSPESLA